MFLRDRISRVSRKKVLSFKIQFPEGHWGKENLVNQSKASCRRSPGPWEDPPTLRSRRRWDRRSPDNVERWGTENKCLQAESRSAVPQCGPAEMLVLVGLPEWSGCWHHSSRAAWQATARWRCAPGWTEDHNGEPCGNQSWVFIGRTDAEAETPILWLPDVKNWPTRKDPDVGKDWRREEKGTTEDETVGWHHRLDWHEFEQAAGVGDVQGSLMCCSPQGPK